MTRRAIGAWLGGLALLAGCAGGHDGAAGPHPSPSAGSATGPRLAIDADFPDPDVLLVGTTYYAYATQRADNSANVQVARSHDLKSWQLLPTDALPTLPAWAVRGRTWAPDVSRAGDRFVMYFTAHSAAPDRQCIGVATAAAPTGPFIPVGRTALVCPAAEGGAIDPASFVDRDGSRYLLWKNDGNCCGLDTWLQLQRTTADGLALTGASRRLVREDRPWEGMLVEAPTLWRHGSTYVLLYSANDYGGERYATGYATATSVVGPYTKAGSPLLSTAGFDGTVTGPGGQDVVTAPDGSDRIVFHGWDATITYRGMYTARLVWNGNRPVVPG